MMNSAPPTITTSQCLWAWTGLMAVLCFIGLSIGLPWWQQLHTLDTQLERQQEQIARYQHLVATIPQLRAELAQVKTQDNKTKAFYFSAATISLAGAQLQEQVQEMVRQAGARPVSTQILPVDNKEQPPRVRIRIQLQGTNAALLALVYHLESARPFLFIDQLSIRSAASDLPEPPVRRGRLPSTVQPAITPRERDDLTIRLDIFGFVLGSAAP